MSNKLKKDVEVNNEEVIEDVEVEEVEIPEPEVKAEETKPAVAEPTFLQKTGTWLKTKGLPVAGKVVKTVAVGTLVFVAGAIVGKKISEADGEGGFKLDPDSDDYTDYLNNQPDFDVVDLPDTDYDVTDVADDAE